MTNPNFPESMAISGRDYVLVSLKDFYYFLKEAIVSFIINGAYCIIFLGDFLMYLFNFYGEQLTCNVFFFFIYCFSLGKQDIYHHVISS